MKRCSRTFYASEGDALAKVKQVLKTRAKAARYENQKRAVAVVEPKHTYCGECRGWHVSTNNGRG